MRKIVIILILSLFNNLVQSQQTKSLRSGWKFVRTDLGSIWEALRPASPGSPQAVPQWQSVSLPHTYNAEDAVDPNINYYEGPAWYRTNITVNNPYKNGRTLLHFEGSGQKTEVYIHTQKVGEHIGGYDEWTIDITEAIQAYFKQEKSNRLHHRIPLVIRTDNSRDTQLIPSDMADFTLYGGLYREVHLIYQPAAALELLHITPTVDSKGQRGKAVVEVSFYNPDQLKKAHLLLQIFNPKGKIIKTFRKDLALSKHLQAITDFEVEHPDLWSPKHPYLYRIKATLTTPSGTHSKSHQFGFRHFEFVKHGPFKLNGKRLLLRGTHRHQDWAGVGAAETKEMIRKELEMIKNMGANFIRLGHHQQSSYVLELCDSLGLLVWEEIPWNRGGLGGKAFKTQAKRMLTNMIQQHYNHPSIIIWSLGNEMDWPGDFPHYSKDSVRAFMQELNTLSHRLDSHRKTAIRRADFARDIVDVYSPSIWAGWYSGRYTEYKEASHKQIMRIDHFFHAEWGADALAGRHTENPYQNIGGIPTGQGVAEQAGDASLTGGNARVSRDGDWSETYQCDLIDWYLKEQENMPWLTGTAYWIFKDFATPLRPNNPIPYVNTKGIVARDLTPKEAYYVFQSYWSDELMAHIYGHTWPIRWGKPGEVKTIKVYSNAEKAELLVNGKSYGFRKRDNQNFPAAGLRWKIPMHQGSYHVEVIAYKNGKEVTDAIDFQYQTQKWGQPHHLELSVKEKQGDITTVIAKAYDKNGVQCLDADNFVNFSLAGTGHLIDNQGTSDGSRKVQLYNGRALIRVQTNEDLNAVGVSSPGLKSAILLLN